MAKIVLSTMGSLGDLHPMIALGLELRKRGHIPVINTWNGYADKIVDLGLHFHPLHPDIDPEDAVLARRVMDSRTGPEVVIRELIFPHLREMYADVTAACQGADLLINGEIVYAARSVAEATGIKWISTSLAPLAMFSSYDPNVYPTAQWLEYLRPLPVAFHDALFGFMRWTLRDWFEPYKIFRRELGFADNLDPVFTDKYSKLLHLAMFSKALGKPQPDWFSPTLQTGFCFYDESGKVSLQPELDEFIHEGEPPIVFTLGSAAVMDARDFFDESAKAAKMLGRRAVLLYGRDKTPPKGLDDRIVGFETTPYSLIFPHASCVVHQGGVGTTSQALAAGAAQLIVPFSHDQPDNAARCRRAGVAEIMDRDSYTAETATAALGKILNDGRYLENAGPLKQIIASEHGTRMACDAIEVILRK
jgi:rhamnosyltransferase subunit B